MPGWHEGDQPQDRFDTADRSTALALPGDSAGPLISAGIRAHPPRPSEFLAAWFAGCPPDHLLELRALRVSDGRASQEFFSLHAALALYGRACALVDDHDCFFGVCPRIRPQGRAVDA